MFRALNDVLTSDSDRKAMQQFAPLLRGISAYLQPGGGAACNPAEGSSRIVFRASRSNASDFDVDTWYRFPMLVATSTNPNNLSDFIKPHGIVIKMSIPPGCMNAGYIEDISWCAHRSARPAG